MESYRRRSLSGMAALRSEKNLLCRKKTLGCRTKYMLPSQELMWQGGARRSKEEQGGERTDAGGEVSACTETAIPPFYSQFPLGGILGPASLFQGVGSAGFEVSTV